MKEMKKNMTQGTENKLYEGSVFTKLILFALPFLASNIVQSFYSVADILIVGNFSGPESMSGVNIGGQVTLVLTKIVIGLCMGATVLIGQYLGAGNRELLKKVTSTIITLLLAIGLGITVIMLAARGPILRMVQTPAESYAESESYLTVTVLGLVFIFGYNALGGIMRGMGDSKRPFYFVMVACITNVALDLLFVAVFKWRAFGAALATIMSQALSMFLCIWYMRRNNFQFDFRLSSFKVDRAQLKLILKLGLPTSVQNGITSMSFLFITAIINIVGGVSASAAVGAVSKVNNFAFMPAMALSAAISAMAAQSIGAGNISRAVRACQIGTVISVAVTYVFFVLLQIYPGAAVSLFGDDPRMIADGIAYLHSFSYDFLFIPFNFCINALFIAGGHARFTLINSMLSSVLLRVPICYIFSITLGWGMWGAGLAAPAASAGVMLVILGFLFSGKWKQNAAIQQ
ncbi:MAG: MATE family efflux transporter [Clostridiales bacterium]|nr:MATE family efflux transporter [Clostridiales bacterium]